MSIDSNTREVNLSIKALQMAEEKQAMKDYGSVDSGASLGDILGAALEEKANKTEVKPKAKKITKDSSKKASPKKTAPKKTEPKEKKPESKK
jgi:small subunit ribosomal protein S1